MVDAVYSSLSPFADCSASATAKGLIVEAGDAFAFNAVFEYATPSGPPPDPDITTTRPDLGSTPTIAPNSRSSVKGQLLPPSGGKSCWILGMARSRTCC